MDVTNFMVSPIMIIGIIVGVTEFVKKFNVAGKWLTVVALVLGFLFGGVFYAMETGMLTDIAPYITMLFYGLTFGMTASGLYDFTGTIIAKARGLG